MAIYYGDGSNSNGSSDGGRIVQVKQSVLKGTASFYGDYDNAFTVITGLTVDITPKDNNNKILCQLNLHGSMNGRYSGIRLRRDSTEDFAIGNADSNKARVTATFPTNNDVSYHGYVLYNTQFSYLDSPATTSQVSYQITMNNCNTNSVILYVNRMHEGSNSTWNTRSISTFTCTEIAYT